MSARGIVVAAAAVGFSAWVASRLSARWACVAVEQSYTDPDTGEVFTSDYGGSCESTPPVPLFVAIARAARARFAKTPVA